MMAEAIEHSLREKWMSYVQHLNDAFKESYDEGGKELHEILKASVKDTEGAGVWAVSPMESAMAGAESQTFKVELSSMQTKAGRMQQNVRRKQIQRKTKTWFFFFTR